MNEFVNNLVKCPIQSECCGYVCYHMKNNSKSLIFASETLVVNKREVVCSAQLVFDVCSLSSRFLQTNAVLDIKCYICDLNCHWIQINVSLTLPSVT